MAKEIARLKEEAELHKQANLRWGEVAADSVCDNLPVARSSSSYWR